MVTAMSTAKAKVMGTATAMAKAGALDIQDAVNNLEDMVGSYKEQMAAPPDAGAGAGVGASDNGGKQICSQGTRAQRRVSLDGEAGAGGMLQVERSADKDLDGGPLPLPSLPPYTMKPFTPSPSYKKRKTVIGYYPLWQWYDCNKLMEPVNVNFAKYSWITMLSSSWIRRGTCTGWTSGPICNR